jgi:hypothetical protein
LSLQLEVEFEALYPEIRGWSGGVKVAPQMALGFVAQNERIADEFIDPANGRS